MFRQHVKHYHQWVHSSILKTKFSQNPPDSIRLQSPSKRTSSDLLYPVSSILKTKFSQNPPDSIRLQSPSKRTSSDLLYPVSSVNECNRKGEKCKISWVLQSPVYCAQASPNSRKYLWFCHRSQVCRFTSLPFGLAMIPEVFTLIVKKVKLMALTRGIRLHQYLDDWLMRAQSQKEAQVNTQTVVDLTQSLEWIINLEKCQNPLKCVHSWATNTI